VDEHWIYGKDDGGAWGRLRYDPASRSFEFLYQRGGNVLRSSITENPNFDPTDMSPQGQANRWVTSRPEIIGPRATEEAPSQDKEIAQKQSPSEEPKATEPEAPAGPKGAPEPEAVPSSLSSRISSTVDAATPGAAKALAVAGAVYAAYDISKKTDQTTREKGALMGVAQFGKTSAKHATAVLWFAIGASVALTLASGGTAAPLAAAAIGALVATAGTAATHNAIDQATPDLR
jgi:hypothetical protein